MSVHIDAVLENEKLSHAALRKLAAFILQMSNDPSRNKVVSRLYALAHRRGDNDAGYSWATMVLEGMAPSDEEPKRQADEAMALYADLARKGHPQALFGLGRVLLAQITLAPETAKERIPRVIELWQRAGKGGMPDAWYELGRLHQSGQYFDQDLDKALTCFEHGARTGSALSCHALGVLHSARAKQKQETGDHSGAQQATLLSNRYFLQAAQKGHAPSAYNMGLRYLLPEEHDPLVSREKLRDAHQARWGLTPDDRSAREWFAAASTKSTSSH